MRAHEPLFNALAERLFATGLRANTVSLASIPPALIAGICAAQGWFWASAAFFMLSGLADLLDGALARTSGTSSRFGALLDSSLDRVADGCIPLGLIVFYAPYGAVAILPGAALLFGLWIPYIRARAQSLQIELPRLWMRREDRFGLVLLGLILAPFDWAQYPLPAMPLLVVLMAIALPGAIAGIIALRAAARGE